jgi:hypothetical protein
VLRLRRRNTSPKNKPTAPNADTGANALAELPMLHDQDQTLPGEKKRSVDVPVP